MDNDSLDALVRRYCEATPFQPFTITLISGEKIEIDHPRAIITRDGLAVIIGPGGSPSWFKANTVARAYGGLAGELSTSG